jgi:hypothetical protein
MGEKWIWRNRLRASRGDDNGKGGWPPAPSRQGRSGRPQRLLKGYSSQKMQRISPQSPQNGKKTHPIAPEGEKCRKIAKNEPQNAKNGLKTAVFRVWRGRGGEKSRFFRFSGFCGAKKDGSLMA